MQGNTALTGPAAGEHARRREAIQEWLLSKVSEALAADPAEIDLREPLSTYGLGSIAAVGMTGDLETWLGLELSPTLFWEHPTIEALAAFLEESAGREGGRA